MDSTLWFNPNHRDLLHSEGFRTLADFLSKGRVIRRRDGKENVEVTLSGHEGAPLSGFLKRHDPSPEAPGLLEWENTKKVASLGIPVPEVLASGAGPEGSFIMTAGIRGGSPLDDHFEAHFSFPLAGEKIRRKRALLRGVADIARTLHQGGLCHRDLYLCHFFVVPEDGDGLTLIDLQRVRPASPLRLRWIVKDLAALNYSTPTGVISRSDRLRFFRAYLEGDPLEKSPRKLIRRVLRKTRRIRHHNKGK